MIENKITFTLDNINNTIYLLKEELIEVSVKMIPSLFQAARIFFSLRKIIIPVEIVKSKTGHNWEWEASLADNDEVWQ